MPAPELHVDPAVGDDLAPVLAAIRGEFDVPTGFAPEVLAEAEAAARSGGARPPGAGATDEDLRPICAFVTIDPEGSRDLDQAYLGERRAGGGYRIHYAIADVAWFVAPGGAVDREAHRRGLTLYLPDRRTPLYPEVLSQGAASLLPDDERRALLWTIDLDADAMPVGTPRVPAGHGAQPAAAELRRGPGRDRRRARPTTRCWCCATSAGCASSARPSGAAISLRLPDAGGRGRRRAAPRMAFAAPLPVEGWNAQISLLTGIVAAGIMLERPASASCGRCPPRTRRRSTSSAGSARRPGGRLARRGPLPGLRARASTPPTPPARCCSTSRPARCRGAGYTAFDGEVPRDPVHAAVASPYAHVTAPLRRLADRQANEILPRARRRHRAAGLGPRRRCRAGRDDGGRPPGASAALERAIIDGAEAVVLAPASARRSRPRSIAVDAKRSRATIQLADPAVIAPLDGTAAVGPHSRCASSRPTRAPHRPLRTASSSTVAPGRDRIGPFRDASVPAAARPRSIRVGGADRGGRTIERS